MVRSSLAKASFATFSIQLWMNFSGYNYDYCCDGFTFSWRSFSENRNVGIPRKRVLYNDEKVAVGRLVLHASDDQDDDETFDIDLGDQDWRAFRAKLVMSDSTTEVGEEAEQTIEEDDSDLDGIGAIFASKSSDTASVKDFSMTPLDPSQWAYDSGKVIEQGAVILGGVEQEYGFGLRQQYFHKVAILVLDHDEKTFTKGIILNRPTDLTLEDDINDGVKWRVWFGGDVQG